MRPLFSSKSEEETRRKREGNEEAMRATVAIFLGVEGKCSNFEPIPETQNPHQQWLIWVALDVPYLRILGCTPVWALKRRKSFIFLHVFHLCFSVGVYDSLSPIALLLHREHDLEIRAHIWFTFRPNIASMILDYFADNR